MSLTLACNTQRIEIIVMKRRKLPTLLRMLLILACASNLHAQDEKKKPDDPTAELQRRYDEAIAKPYVKAGGWVLDYDVARERAIKEGKLIFAYFSRSYAP